MSICRPSPADSAVYYMYMEGALEETIEALRNLPEDRQERVARAIINYALDEAEPDLE